MTDHEAWYASLLRMCLRSAGVACGREARSLLEARAEPA